MHAIALAENSRSLALTWEDGRASEFHYVWLRDNCRCSRCRSPQTFERVSFTGDIPLDITPREANLSADGGLEVIWSNDGMRSSYPGDWLYAHRYAPERPEVPAVEPKRARTLWATELNPRVPSFSYNEVIGSDDGLLTWIETLVEYGLVLTRGVPTDPRPDLDPEGETTQNRRDVRQGGGEVERFANHVACIRQDVFDSGTADMKVDPTGYAQALTPNPVGAAYRRAVLQLASRGAVAALSAAGRVRWRKPVRGWLSRCRATARGASGRLRLALGGAGVVQACLADG